jgi:flagellar assembly protein FliH
MNDLAGLLGKAQGFQPDARFAAMGDDGAALPASLGALTGRMARHAPMPEPEPPAPDPIAEAAAQSYAQGAADTRAAMEAQAAQDEAARAPLAHAFARIDGELAEQFRQRLMETVVALCEATLAPLALDRDALARRVERAAAMFSRADDERLIRLHPEDLRLIKPQLPKDWHYAPDPALERGAIRVEQRQGGVEGGGVEDGPTGWRNAIAQALDIGGLD